MKKLFKFILILILLFGLLLVGGAFMISTINPNDFKPQIISEVKKATGRDLTLNGDITWRFFPTLGLSIEDLALKNPTGFKEENMVSFSRAEVSVDVLPLMSKQIKLGVVRLDDAHIFIQTLKDGANNLSFVPETTSEVSQDTSVENQSNETLSTPSESQLTAAKTSESDANVTTHIHFTFDASQAGTDADAPWVISIAGLEIKQASAQIIDDQTQSNIQLTSMNVDMGQIGFETWIPVHFDIEGTQNALAFKSKGSLEALLKEDLLASKLRQIILTASASDADFTLQQASIKLDKFALDHTGKLKIQASGETGDLGFSTQGKINVRLEKETSRVEITEIDLGANLDGTTLPRQKMTLGFNGDAIWDGKKQTFDLANLTLKADEISLSGDANIQIKDIPQVRFTLESQLIDLDQFMGIKTEMQAKSQKVESEKSEKSENGLSTPVSNRMKFTPAEKAQPRAAMPALSKVEPDLSALKGLDIAGEIKIAQFIASNIHVNNVQAKFAIDKGIVSIDKFDAKLYEGSVTTKAKLDVNQNPAKYSLSQVVSKVQIQPLLIDAAGTDFIAGNGNIDIQIKGQGLSAYQLRQGITGRVAVNFADGALYGINVPEMIREAKAALKGKSAEYVQEVRKTDFSGLVASFELANGIAKTENVKLEAPLIRVRSEGETNLIAESLDFNLFVSVVGSSKGQGGQDIDKLRDLTIPVKVYGTWLAPDYKIDFKSFLKANRVIENKLKEKAQEGLNKLLGGQSENEDLKKVTDQLLNGLFN